MLRAETKSLWLCLLLVMSSLQAEEESATHQFNAQTSRIMDILVNSLYTQREIFLRQIISNGSDALDKIRFMALTDDSILKATRDLEIRIEINEELKYIQVRDTGIGMTKEELIKNLGTIAQTGTNQYLSALKQGKINLIGQFGVGFYSTFLVAAKVEVISKSNNDDQYRWISQSAASFTIEKDPQGNTLGRGTIVRLYLKEDSLEFLSHKKIAKLIKKHSEFIDFPIYLNNKKEIEEEAPITQNIQEEEKDLQIKQKQEEKPKTQKIKRTVFEWEKINANKALWLREKDQIYEQDYIDFYKSITKQSNLPMNWIHFNTEGEVTFTSILYIPNRSPVNFYSNYNTRKLDLKLYIRRVLISEKKELIPRYLSFVLGVVDSDNLEINVQRQTLQDQKIFKVINQKITKKILDMITELTKYDFVEEDEYEDELDLDSEEMALMNQEELESKKKDSKDKIIKQKKEKYQKFYDEFGKAIKLGILEDKTNRNKLAALSRWYSSRDSQRTSFDEYIKRMKTVQDQIYFFSGEDKSVLRKSPLVVGLTKKGYEVILCDDPIDQYVFSVLREYEGKNIVNVGKGDFKMPDDDQHQRKKQKFLTNKYQPYIKYVTKLLFEKVNNVVISNRLTNEPCVVVADTYGHSSFMDKIQKAQMFAGGNEDNPTSDFKKIMEINPHHRLNQIILDKIINNQTNTEVEELVELLYETAAFHSGFSAKDENDFVRRFYKTYSKAMGVVSLERKEVEINQDVELDEDDYEGDNEEQIRLNPADMQMQPEIEE